MSDEPVLGYRADGSKIRQSLRGSIVTQAFIFCHHCNKAIKSTGGPGYGSTCLECWDKGYRYREEQGR